MSLYDKERRKLAREYNRQKDLRKIINKFALIFFWILFFVLSLETRLYNTVRAVLDNRELTIILFIFLFLLLYSLFRGILNYFLIYRLEVKYDLRNHSTTGWVMDNIKSFLISFLFLYFAGRFFIFLSASYPQNWWIYFAVAGIIFSLIITFLLPVVILPLFYNLTPYPEGPVKEHIMKTIERAGIVFDDIYEIDLSSRVNYANAAVIGLGKTRKIVLGDRLQQKYEVDEIEAITAHELAHHVNGDIYKNLIINSIIILLSLKIVYHVWPCLIEIAGYSSPGAVYSLPLLLIVWGVVSIFFRPLQLFWSRYRERKADDYACQLIDNPASLARGLAKLADESLAKLSYNRYELLFEVSHPPIGSRVDQAFEKENIKE